MKNMSLMFGEKRWVLIMVAVAGVLCASTCFAGNEAAIPLNCDNSLLTLDLASPATGWVTGNNTTSDFKYIQTIQYGGAPVGQLIVSRLRNENAGMEYLAYDHTFFLPLFGTIYGKAIVSMTKDVWTNQGDQQLFGTVTSFIDSNGKLVPLPLTYIITKDSSKVCFLQ
jgi:hypothetical protein